ncbi:ABC transporter permease [Syntrophorhabdus aromaticivorans]|uniref:FtsX-like permease family protein n=1 Tax=Syntrophorhabdus aromaticivorans TaxID=328301 RepID=A0A971S0M2_9BACT|nr:ABC transporter permease [Syntrophorhabdus aromaticivorans]NLW35540.1 FtsX-like permease family protein [Syntrophorhabdus aromaticivorans]
MIYAVKFYLKIALQNLVVHKARMTLALLGILFAVMSLVAFGNISGGLKKQIDSEISKFGKNLVILRSGSVHVAGRGTHQFGESTTLKLKDVERIRESLKGIAEVVPFHDVTYPARYEDKTLTVSVVGTTDRMFAIRNLGLAMGTYFSKEDDAEAAKKAVVGYKVFDNLFQQADPIGKHILILKVPTEIIGVMDEKGTDLAGQDQDLQVYMPLNAFMRRYSNVDYIKGAYIQVQDGVSLVEMKTVLRDFIRRIHNLKTEQRDDFSIFTMDDVMKTQEQGIRLVSILTIIASTVSFLIGGLGIFAIMLLSISERKLEIGIRRVVGSKKRDIILQFLTESVIVALIGGACGVTAGFVITLVVSYFGGLPFSLYPGNIVLSLVISTAVGMLAGIYPAMQGTKYEPVEILH